MKKVYGKASRYKRKRKSEECKEKRSRGEETLDFIKDIWRMELEIRREELEVRKKEHHAKERKADQGVELRKRELELKERAAGKRE